MKNINNEKGMILLTVLMLMFIGAILGIIAINNATMEVDITGYNKRVSSSFVSAEGGVDLATNIIESTLLKGTLSPSSFSISGNAVVLDTTKLGSEIQNPSFSNHTDTLSFSPDVKIASLGGAEVNIDIDRLYSRALAGGALEFAMGYEGVGAGAAGGGVAIYYRINSAGEK